jgi:hypothetical protein
MTLLSVDDSLSALAVEAEQRGYALLVSGRTVIAAEYHRQQIVWYVGDRRDTFEGAQRALADARAARAAQLIA